MTITPIVTGVQTFVITYSFHSVIRSEINSRSMLFNKPDIFFQLFKQRLYSPFVLKMMLKFGPGMHQSP